MVNYRDVKIFELAVALKTVQFAKVISEMCHVG